MVEPDIAEKLAWSLSFACYFQSLSGQHFAYEFSTITSVVSSYSVAVSITLILVPKIEQITLHIISVQ